ncbi:WD domain, G-beta repeat containing protein, putative [Babesia bigemina]|uniref:WD domain, G-beta repeat containing protein, putative n=1 Tax=Babesia bigemina TaxID=5866 RepID=A0A061DDK9_BABBI|nr:WD domain, G-beta repeat containing protein, putative [Babesia bigemina]CDR96340.1 WD domain, G-beta repeat containing protein, putative [Babesia bigemina]|eukprot:XP_012768526.1 WD domain, G-beta repeat containing protein, putative [Babesia bigemina]
MTFGFQACPSSVRIWHLKERADGVASKAHLCASYDAGCGMEYDIVLEAVIDNHFKKTVRSVRFSSDGRYLICASFDGTATVWGRENDDLGGLRKVEPETVHDSLASNDSSGLQTWSCLCVLEGHENEVKCAAFDCTSTYIATCGRDKTVWIHQRSYSSADNDAYDIARLPQGPSNGPLEFYCTAILTGHTQDVKCVCWSTNALLLASSSYDETVRLWGLIRQDWVCIQTLSMFTSTVWSVSFDVDGSRLAAGAADGTVFVFQIAIGKQPNIEDWLLSAILAVKSTQNSWTSRHIFLGTKARDYVEQLTELQRQVACTGAILKLGPIDATFSHVMARKMSKIRDHQLKHPLIADDWQPCHCIESHHSRPVYSVDLNTLLLTGGGDNMVKIMHPGNDGDGRRIEFVAHNSDVNGVSWKRHDSRLLFATVGDDEYIKVWKLVDT